MFHANAPSKSDAGVFLRLDSSETQRKSSCQRDLISLKRSKASRSDFAAICGTGTKEKTSIRLEVGERLSEFSEKRFFQSWSLCRHTNAFSSHFQSSIAFHGRSFNVNINLVDILRSASFDQLLRGLTRRTFMNFPSRSGFSRLPKTNPWKLSWDEKWNFPSSSHGSF